MLNLSKWVQVVKDDVNLEDIADLEKRLGNGEQFGSELFSRYLDENEKILFTAIQLEKFQAVKGVLVNLLIKHFFSLLTETNKQKINLFVVTHGFRLTGRFDQQLHEAVGILRGFKCCSLAIPFRKEIKPEIHRTIDGDFSTMSTEQAIQKVFDTGGSFTDNGNDYFVPVDKNGKPVSFGTGDICQQFPKTLWMIRLIEKYSK
ncbi:MAG: hypothetical protein WC422_00115 [Candidatus Paceibacterota bacterium]|jgi:hypothetical protein